MDMEIAHVGFSLHSSCLLDAGRLPQTYRQFFTDGGPAWGDSIEVTLEHGTTPDISNFAKIFDTGSSWSMFRKENEYVISLHAPGFDREIVWHVHFDRGLAKVAIYCGNMLISRENGHKTISIPFSYPIDQILLMYILSDRDGALIHAAGAGIDGRGYIFPGRSGAGKSTLSKFFLGRNTVEMLSDDRVVIRKINGSFRVYGTPWAGDAGIAENKEFPLKGIFFIHHGDKNRIREMTPREATEKLMPVTSIPWFDRDVMPRILDFCEELVSNIPAYQFYFKPDAEAVDCLKEFVAGNED